MSETEALVVPKLLQAIRMSQHQIEVAGRVVHVRLATRSPRIVLLENVLSPDECERLIAAARPLLSRAVTVDWNSGDYVQTSGRTCDATLLAPRHCDVIGALEQRVVELTGIPGTNGEPLQVIRYGVGTEFKPHFDAFDVSQPGDAKHLASGGQRIATVLLYLNDVEAGGETCFPRIGLNVMPKRGSALFFVNASPSGLVDELALHGGQRVLAGEKWVATKWLRERTHKHAATGLADKL